MGLVEGNIVSELDKKLFEKAVILDQETDYIQGQGQGGEKMKVQIISDCNSVKDHEEIKSPCYKQIMLK